MQAEYAAEGEAATGGVNCSERLDGALKQLQENPYWAVGVAGDGAAASEGDVKKGYRKFALKVRR